MRFIQLTVVLALCFAATMKVVAGPARIWFSTSNTSPLGWDAPTIAAPEGRDKTLYIWAQPATSRILESFALDIVTQSESVPFVDFINGTFHIYNDPETNQQKRFQFTKDSSTIGDLGGQLTSEKSASEIINSNVSDSIIALQGLSPLLEPSVVGIGNTSDPRRASTNHGTAWLVAEVGFKAVRSSGTDKLFLRVGNAGIQHSGEGGTSVVFGNDIELGCTPNNLSTCTTYNADTMRQTTLPSDTFDIRINAVPFTPGDYNSDGIIGSGDITFWQSSFGQSVLAGTGADGDGNGRIDAADYVFLRKRMSGGSGLDNNVGDGPVVVVPEPGVSILASLFATVLLTRIRREVVRATP